LAVAAPRIVEKVKNSIIVINDCFRRWFIPCINNAANNSEKKAVGYDGCLGNASWVLRFGIRFETSRNI
jgi:hypothetical protein